jgi:phosphate transport system protein
MVKMDTQLMVFKETILEMAQKVRIMHELALKVSMNGDVNLAFDIIKMDEFVNNYQIEVNDLGLDVLALLAPVASDLRVVISGIKIATDLERLGDYAKLIAEYVVKCGQLDDEILPYLKDVSDYFFDMFDATMQAYRENDVKAALELPLKDRNIDYRMSELSNYIEQQIKDGKEYRNIVRTLSVLRSFERSGDHTKNINEHLIYQVKGQHYDFG